jgi:putative two-component system response regulator
MLTGGPDPRPQAPARLALAAAPGPDGARRRVRAFAATMLEVSQAVEVARSGSDALALCTALHREGELLLLDGHPNAALQALLEAVGLCPPEALEIQARLWQRSAHAQSVLASPGEAQEYLGLALDLMRRSGHASGVIDILEDLAELHARQGELGWALSHLETNLSLRRELRDEAGLCRTLLAAGKLGLRQVAPHIRAARRYLEEAAELASTLGLASLEAQAQGWLAHAYALGGEYERAGALFELSYLRLEQQGDLSMLAQIRLGQARLAAAQNQPGTARTLGAQALDLSRRSSSPHTEVPVLLLLSTQAEAMGDLSAALAHHRAYHDLSVSLGRAQSDHRTRQIAVRLDLESSRQEAELQRQRGGRLERRVAERTAQLEATQAEMIELLASAAECRDAPQGLHAFWVGEASARVARQLGWTPARAHDLGLAARLHDIGKLAIPDSVLLKQGPLSEEERTLVQTHTTLGARLLERSASPLLQLAAEVALSHHERWDGSGYPAGAQGDQASQAGRIVAVVDTFDALLSQRSYKLAWTAQDAADYLQAQAGTQFDAEVVRALLWLHEQGDLPPREASVTA